MKLTLRDGCGDRHEELAQSGGDFWEWREQMYRAAEGWTTASYLEHCRGVFREMLRGGITAVGEFHYLHGLGNDLGDAVQLAATQEGIRLTLIDACYLQGGVDGRPLEGAQRSFSDGDIDAWDGVSGLDPSPTPEPSLTTLYGSKDVYMLRYRQATRQSIQDGFLLLDDAQEVIEQAEESSVPDGTPGNATLIPSP